MSLTDRIAPWAPTIVGLYLIGKMFYVFGAGAAQPADLLLAGVALLMAPPRWLAGFLREELALFLLLAWVAIVAAVWAAIRTQPEFLVRGPLYLGFNVLAAAAVVGARERDPERFDRIVTVFLFVSVLVQFAAALVLPEHVNKDGVPREIGTFANPNQLAYWSICTMSLWLVLRRCAARPIDLLTLALLGAVQVMTLSRAGMGAMAIGLAIWAWFALTPRLRLAAAILLVAVASLAAIPAVRAPIAGTEIYAGLHQRVTKSDKYSSLTERNADRLFNYPQYLAFGAGEADRRRFTQDDQLEVHSTVGALLFGYGAVGLALFAWVFVGIVRTAPLRACAQLVAPFIFTLAHNGLRFTFFWVLVAVLLSLGRNQRPAPA